MEYCITVNPIPHSQYRTKFDYEWSIEYQLIRNPLVSVNIRSANLLIFKILYYGMYYVHYGWDHVQLTLLNLDNENVLTPNTEVYYFT